ncbi:CGNR zinc finger domain-containing protein [Nesterenkonia ebinurensis]|uniref:CGNR zinc finger domain-containing protein n=1 Tax=Nesterenkonia ebinurensis TaxID=2608252 RepID=UPI00123DA8E1|nr:CGNR zinc finger domain-containing protein [Nesterenkonia ebinurensis]
MVTLTREHDWDPSTPAPAGLEPVRRLVNTLDLYRKRDHLETEAAARSILAVDWPASEDGPQISEPDLLPLRGARTAIRDLLGGRRGGLEQFRIHLSITGAEIRVPPDLDPVDGYISQLILELYVAEHTGKLRRLKLCANEQCRWGFWDASRPGTGKWCSMQVCGGQHKARQYRKRKRAQS